MLPPRSLLEYPAPGCLNDVPKGGCKGDHTPLQLKEAAFASQNTELKSIPFNSRCIGSCLKKFVRIQRTTTHADIVEKRDKK